MVVRESSRIEALSALRLTAALHPRPEPHVFYDRSKRVLDVVLALLLLVASAPLVLLCALLIFIESPGNPFYVQRRVGLFGTEFAMLKLRTMRADADGAAEGLDALNVAGGPAFKAPNDPRRLRFGRLLRRLSIDELPQFVNVLAGQMSLVGPRPPLPREVARYSDGEAARLAVKPGLTCTWQVSGRSDIPWERWVAMDLRYIRERSLGHDLAILARTPLAVLSMRGAH